MAQKCPKRPLAEKSDSSSDNESVETPAKQPNIPKRGSPKEAIKSTKENLVSKKSPEVANPSQKKVTLTTTVPTTEIQDKTLRRGDFCDTKKVSPEDEAADALKQEYMQKYASVYSKELLFAVDVMNLVRLLNQLPSKLIMYATHGELPKSPCDNILDDALTIFWKTVKDRVGKVFEAQLKNKQITYNRFQKMVLLFAERTEHKEYGEKAFLFYCLALAQWAIYAEQNGIPDASEFIPLVICRTIQNLKDSGKLASNFWERIAELALKSAEEE